MSDTGTRTYYCTATGHLIPADQLSQDTELLLVDGAEVRICLRHGSPIAESEPAA
ncbi:MAG: hypothetical protein ACRDFS_00495 [Chloroflexota bacterium]